MSTAEGVTGEDSWIHWSDFCKTKASQIINNKNEPNNGETV